MFIGSIAWFIKSWWGFISIFSSKYFYGDKFRVRKAIAIAYLLFGLTQILVLNIIDAFTINKHILYYVIFALLSFYISNLLLKNKFYKLFKNSLLNSFSLWIYIYLFIYFELILITIKELFFYQFKSFS